jgi:hypothetical protein
MEARIAATILVNHRFLVSERKDAGNRHIILGRKVNLQIVTEFGNQLAKPGKGLWKADPAAAA